jgi:hypothetical protein
LKVSRYYCRRHEAGTLKATYHGFHVISSKGSPYLTLFQETSLNFLKSLKPFLFYVEEVLLRVCWDQWFEMRLQLPRNYRIFGTIWTSMGHNPSFTNWYFDPGDFGLAVLLYFGEFSGGELQIGPPFCKTVQLENLDLVFVNSFQVFHRSLFFKGDRVNFIFYSSLIKQKDLKLIIPTDLQ